MTISLASIETVSTGLTVIRRSKKYQTARD